MNRPSSPESHEQKLHACVDGRLGAEQAQTVRQQADPATRDTLAAWDTQRQALRALHTAVLNEPVPASMREVAERAARDRANAANQVRWAGMAASVILSFGLGWVLHGLSAHPQGTGMAQLNAQTQFVRAAGYAHAVYQPEKRHPVEVGAAEQEHLVQWLSKRLGRPLRVPDLSAEGYALVGGRLLPGEGSARAQFMFEDAHGQRLTLYLGGITATEQHPELAQTRFQFESRQGTQSFYWFDRDFGYALSGALGREALLAVATRVYQQLESKP
ncbi:anti-sigma factor [Curvibacter sp. APW13]|uniref:anti-sigma factor family protein n=1 Tax=Curvibacter sp. APW13 TaxID=3077236 RepID=UPI0028DDB8DD|nr:anti-sigma factor [Curvibacter sp. APW13]MDT8990638.1 anti-sigma factor [Curvibacter sp. APW13]